MQVFIPALFILLVVLKDVIKKYKEAYKPS